MNVTSLTLYISQITFGIIFLFALTSFIIYKLRGKNGGNAVFQPEIQHEQHNYPVTHFDNQKTSANVVSYSVESMPLSETIISTASISRNSFAEVKTISKTMKNRSRFTVMNNTFEPRVEKPRTENNWA